MASSQHGAWVWYELMTSDPAAAAAFYGDVVGWQARDAGYPDMAYTLFSWQERDVCGMMQMPAESRAAGMPAHWVGYIAVDDVDASAADLAHKGGTVHRAPDDIPGIGRFSVVADPSGAPFVLFHPSLASRPATTPGVGDFGWHELMADEPDAAFAFYADLFGWTKAHAIDMGPMGVYQIFAHGERPVGGIMKKPADMPAARWRYYTRVDEIEAAIGKLDKAGGTVVSGPHEVPGDDWVVHATDAQGARFALVSHTR